ncbi:MAG: hypothetical protein BVN35_16060, partial [Proteobacteria bacterium ST_bin11]
MHTHNPFRRTQLSAVILSLLAPGFSVAATANWVGTTGFWDSNTNWSTNPALPASGDDTVLNVAGAQTITVRSNGTPFTVNSINTNGGDEILAITDGRLNLLGAITTSNATGNSSVGTFIQSAGIIGGTGNLSVTG